MSLVEMSILFLAGYGLFGVIRHMYDLAKTIIER